MEGARQLQERCMLEDRDRAWLSPAESRHRQVRLNDEGAAEKIFGDAYADLHPLTTSVPHAHERSWADIFAEPGWAPPEWAPSETPIRSRASDEIGFPERQPGHKMTGSEFVRDVLGVAAADGPYNRGLTGPRREAAILAEIERGNVPDFLRHPKTVVVTDLHGNRAELKVMPDYLAIGTNYDFVRVPVTPLLAQTIAERYGMALPTKKVVDSVYQQAEVRLPAVGLVQSAADQSYMQGNGFYLKHDAIIDRQLADQPIDALVAGHKKDIIVSRYAASHPTRLDFYGFFDGNGKPIQGAHGGPHENTYVDYSHGARLVSQDVIVNGRRMTYDEVLRHPQLAGLVSDDGAFDPRLVYRRPVDTSYNRIVA